MYVCFFDTDLCYVLGAQSGSCIDACADPYSDMILVDGVSAFCDDLQVI